MYIFLQYLKFTPEKCPIIPKNDQRPEQISHPYKWTLGENTLSRLHTISVSNKSGDKYKFYNNPSNL